MKTTTYVLERERVSMYISQHYLHAHRFTPAAVCVYISSECAFSEKSSSRRRIVIFFRYTPTNPFALL